MPRVYTTSRRVEFHQTDAAGIAHFSAFFRYMEEAEHELLRHAGLSVFTEDVEGTLSWPRVSAHCDFHGPARFEDVLQIAVDIGRMGEKSVTYRFRFTLDEKSIASGTMTSVCCRITAGGLPVSIPIPQRILDKLAPFVCD